MHNVKPISDPATPYRIQVQGRVDLEWLQSFDSSAEISVDETMQVEDITVIKICTDQAGILGLVRRLHGLGISILQIQIVSEGGEAAKVEDGR
jgi:hypothetical protein